MKEEMERKRHLQLGIMFFAGTESYIFLCLPTACEKPGSGEEAILCPCSHSTAAAFLKVMNYVGQGSNSST